MKLLTLTVAMLGAFMATVQAAQIYRVRIANYETSAKMVVVRIMELNALSEEKELYESKLVNPLYMWEVVISPNDDERLLRVEYAVAPDDADIDAVKEDLSYKRLNIKDNIINVAIGDKTRGKLKGQTSRIVTGGGSSRAFTRKPSSSTTSKTSSSTSTISSSVSEPSSPVSEPSASAQSSSGTTVRNGKWNRQELSNGNVVFSNGSVTFTMIWVEPGVFTMGGNKTTDRNVTRAELPAHRVTLTKGYYLSETEVTQALWRAVMNEDPTFPGLDLDESVAPKVNVTYKDAFQFVRKLAALTGEQFAIPTEARWEFAARGGVKSQGYIYAGSDRLDEVGWTMYDHVGANALPHAVKTKKANELGIYDMSGNVNEWCSDRYKAYTSRAVTDPYTATGSQFVRRGGSCYTDIDYCRISARNASSGDDRGGVRLMLEP